MLYALWGKKQGYTWQEDLLLSECTKEQAEQVKPHAEKDGYIEFRLSELTNEMPDFTKCLNI